MSTDDPAERRLHSEVEVPATPDEVWDAITTRAGTAAWAFPADIEGRVGGAVTIDRSPYGPPAHATVTAWDPPHHLAYEEQTAPAPDVDELPFVTEILVEAKDGGTCVVRVVNGLRAHGGDEWEDLLEGAAEGSRMALLILKTYLTHFAGEPVGRFDVSTGLGRPLDERSEVSAALMARLGLTGAKPRDTYRTPTDVPALAGVVEHASPDFVQLRIHAPMPGIVEISSFSMDARTMFVNVSTRLYGADAEATAAHEEARWQAWLQATFPAALA